MRCGVRSRVSAHSCCPDNPAEDRQNNLQAFPLAMTYSSIRIHRTTKSQIHSIIMESTQKSQSALFQVYLRLRPPPAQNVLYPTLSTVSGERFLTVEEAQGDGDVYPTHITL